MPSLESLVIILIFFAYAVFLFVWAREDIRTLTSGIAHFEFEEPRKDIWIKILDHRSFNILGWVTGLFYAGVMTCSILWLSGPYAMAYITVATALGALVLGNVFPTLIRKRKAKIVEKEGRRLIMEGMAHEVEALLGGLTARKEKVYVELAVDLLKAWGSFRSMIQLFEFNRKSEIERVSTAYKTGNRLQRVIFNTSHDRWKGVRILVDNWMYWKRLQLAAEGKDHYELLEDLAEQRKVPVDLQKFFKTQYELHQHFPNVFCERDLQRAVIKEINGCRFIRCPHCFSVKHLVYPVEHVVGLIGGEADGKLENGKIHFAYWNADSKTVSKAQVDEIRISDIPNLDWAVAATVEKLENEHPVPKPRIIVENGVTLSPNSLEIIENYNQPL